MKDLLDDMDQGRDLTRSVHKMAPCRGDGLSSGQLTGYEGVKAWADAGVQGPVKQSVRYPSYAAHALS